MNERTYPVKKIIQGIKGTKRVKRTLDKWNKTKKNVIKDMNKVATKA